MNMLKKNLNRIKNLCSILLRGCCHLGFFIIFLLIESCSWGSRQFFIDQLDIHIDVEHVKDDHFRVFLYRNMETMDSTYVDLYYHMSEMPSITLYFPTDDKGEIFIIDSYSEVRMTVSKDFIINLVTPPVVKNGELLNDRTWYELQRYDRINDSINKISSVKVRLDAYLNGLTIWDENENRYQMDYHK